MPTLSILCVTKAEPAVLPFLNRLAEDCHNLGAEWVLVADGSQAFKTLSGEKVFGHGGILARVQSSGFIESVLDDALSQTSGDYILRIDDDEAISHLMFKWLLNSEYADAPHWKFPRAHMWHDGTFLSNLPLWPDHQTRLSVRAMSSGRGLIHCGSPFGGGELAPVYLEHHKFLAKPLPDRQAIVRRYDSIQQGAGQNFAAFSVPELVFPVLDARPIELADEWARQEAAR